jgi:hypothetical protein
MKEKTESAQCAQHIRQDLKVKFPGVKFEIKSSNFANGNSVNVNWIDGPSSIEVEQLISKYEQGFFNSMTDIYENSNFRKDIPQVKYLICNRKMSNIAFDIIVKKLNIDISENYDDYRCNIYDEFKTHEYLTKAQNEIKIKIKKLKKIDKSKILDIDDFFNQLN